MSKLARTIIALFVLVVIIHFNGQALAEEQLTEKDLPFSSFELKWTIQQDQLVPVLIAGERQIKGRKQSGFGENDWVFIVRETKKKTMFIYVTGLNFSGSYEQMVVGIPVSKFCMPIFATTKDKETNSYNVRLDRHIETNCQERKKPV